MELEGKTAIVTGASSGIGAATARMLREAGVGSSAARGASSGSRPMSRSQLDVTDEESCERFVGAPRGLGGIDILVNNAGLALGRDPFTESTEEDERDGLRDERGRPRPHDAARAPARCASRGTSSTWARSRAAGRTRTRRVYVTSKFARARLHARAARGPARPRHPHHDRRRRPRRDGVLASCASAATRSRRSRSTRASSR